MEQERAKCYGYKEEGEENRERIPVFSGNTNI